MADLPSFPQPLPGLSIRREALQDIDGHYAYLLANAGLPTAERFLQALTASYRLLAAMPRMAQRYGFRRQSLSTLRRWPVSGFENWLILYRPRRRGIVVLRVLHGARDIPKQMEPPGE